MTGTSVELPQHTIDLVDEPDADGPLYLAIANTATAGLEGHVIDIRGEVPNAFPPRAPQQRVVTDTASFLAELTRRTLAPDYSTVWGNRTAGEVTAIYNDLDPLTSHAYTRRDDRLVLKFVPDPDWATLLKAADGNWHTQEDFGDLIESAGHLITSHPAAELIEIVDDIRASKSGSFQSTIKRDCGSQHLTYSEEVTTKSGSSAKPLEVPREITLAARPFEDYPEVPVTCWLRLRVVQGQLGLGLFPQPYQHLVRAAWLVVTNGLSDELGVPVYAANLGE